MNRGMLKKKKIDDFASMPTCIINPEVYDFASEPMDYLGKYLQKTNCVSLYPFHNAMPFIDRIYQSENIQSMMLAACIDIRLSSFFGPHSPNLQMKRKSLFIFKKYDPFFLQFVKQNCPQNLQISSQDAEYYITPITFIFLIYKKGKAIAGTQSMNSGFYSSMPFAGLSKFRRFFSFTIFFATFSFFLQTGKFKDLFQLNKILGNPESFIKISRYNLAPILLLQILYYKERHLIISSKVNNEIFKNKYATVLNHKQSMAKLDEIRALPSIDQFCIRLKITEDFFIMSNFFIKDNF